MTKIESRPSKNSEGKEVHIVAKLFYIGDYSKIMVTGTGVDILLFDIVNAHANSTIQLDFKRTLTLKIQALRSFVLDHSSVFDATNIIGGIEFEGADDSFANDSMTMGKILFSKVFRSKFSRIILGG